MFASCAIPSLGDDGLDFCVCWVSAGCDVSGVAVVVRSRESTVATSVNDLMQEMMQLRCRLASRAFRPHPPRMGMVTNTHTKHANLRKIWFSLFLSPSHPSSFFF